MNRIIFLGMFSFMVVLLLSPSIVASEKRLKPTLKAKVTVKINWDIHTEKESNTGHFNTTIQGMLKLDKRFTATEKGLPPVFVAYQSQGLRARYDFEQVRSDKKPPSNCKGPDAAILSRHQGQDTVSIPTVPGDFEFSVNFTKSMLESMGVMALARQMGAGNKDEMVDTLQFHSAGPKVKIPGTRRNNECQQVKDELEINVVPVSIQAIMEESGEFSGGDSWTHQMDSGSADYTVRLHQRPGKDKRAEYSPKYIPGGNVNYSVTWSFEEPSPLVIQRKDGKDWKDVALEDLNKVTVGERVKLRGIIIPKINKAVSGKWIIDDNPADKTRDFIKRFDANEEKSQVVHVREFNQPTIEFCWFRGKEGKVTFETAGSPSLSHTVKFDIKKPVFKYSWVASKESKFGAIGKGDPTLANQLNWNNTKYPQGKTGLQYQGILFQAGQIGGVQGEGQWVQLIEADYTSFYADQGKRWEVEDNRKGLDGPYPMERGFLAYDAPGIIMGAIEKDPVSFSTSASMTMELYFMFRPFDQKGNPSKDNEWVPIHLFHWGWSGKMGRLNAQSPWGKVWSYEPDASGVKVTDEDVDAYPIWKVNADGRIRTEGETEDETGRGNR